MAHSPEIETILAPLRASVKEQGDVVRKLKEDGADTMEIKAAVSELKHRKKALEDKELMLVHDDDVISVDARVRLEDLLRRRFFYEKSFEIYGGIAGLYDYGPMGCAVKTNMLSLWRNHFVIEESMLEVECSMLTPEPVLKASGHVDRFSDFMVKDVKNGDCIRADHLIKHHVEHMLNDKKLKDAAKRKELEDVLALLDGYSEAQIGEALRKYDMKSYDGNDITAPIPFNLMFPTIIGPSGEVKGFLRPETAQGIFVNFKRLLGFNNGRLPFAAAQIGAGFRNEISPRQGLIRVREFTMAEIEHFVDPADKSHPKFDRVRDYKMSFFSACDQMDGKPARRITIGEAVDSGLVANQTLGYYLARVHAYLVRVGIDQRKLRFRQHMSNEMAHYACDCWDAECKTSYGWIECVGNADRSCYDLSQHTKATGVKLVAEKKLPAPVEVDVVRCILDKAAVGKTFKKDAKEIGTYFGDLDEAACASVEKSLESSGKVAVKLPSGKEVEVTSAMLSIKRAKEMKHVEEITPSVIEPSFGIGRIMYAVYEHNFRTREDDAQRTYISIPPIIAPIKCAVLPLSNHADFVPFVRQLVELLTENDVSHKVDDSSGSIGRRYARTDEIAIPFGATVDFDTVKGPRPATVTLRDRDSMTQIRAPIVEIPSIVSDLTRGRRTWDDVQAHYPAFDTQQEATSEGDK